MRIFNILEAHSIYDFLQIAEVKKAKGASYPFSFGDYVVKSLIGSVDPELDGMDEALCNCSCS